eukprot:gnl/MRDRNA2_/MRDRNA2_90059_c0_seq1.p1 gnl/MRDRNA2_/MRDRNA2_90059_c0~~gnl/MRDRNA2_/MRDRNA2_90059_c0_seq1.p1  ORF type:complete len:340 (-),score=94.88 gnl/MRDRNA2_/MRDRNA2_90059_c0_seq1:110-1129(-)
MAKEVMMSDMPGGDSGSAGGQGYGGGPGSSAGANAAVAPVTGLGNYKGVMLCNRPKEGGRGGSGGDGTDRPTPFRSTVSATHNDCPGLNPAGRSEAMQAASRRKPPPKCPVLRRHLKWLKKLQDEMSDQRAENEGRAAAQQEQHERIKAFCEKHREGVQAMITESKAYDDELKEMSHKQHRPVNGQKPAWAMTEEQSEAAEEYDADGLINFAENLDFDQYIHDLEFREALGGIRERAKVMHKEQEAFKKQLVDSYNVADEEAELSPAEDSRSAAPMADRRSQKAASEADGTELSNYTSGTTSAEMAKEAMELNPALKGIHSKASLQKIIEKQSETESAA